jgi:hypothetical protein
VSCRLLEARSLQGGGAFKGKRCFARRHAPLSSLTVAPAHPARISVLAYMTMISINTPQLIDTWLILLNDLAAASLVTIGQFEAVN